MDSYIGETTHRRYEVKELLGRGGFATVHRCVRDDGAEFALKCCSNLLYVGRHRAEEAFLRAAGRAAGAGGEREDGVIGFVESMAGAEAFALELFRGEDLGSWGPLRLGALPAERRHRAVVDLTIRIIDLVLSLHAKSIVHRDLTPSNILVRGELDQYTLRLIDLGIAKHLGAAGPDGGTAEGVWMGTAGYCAREQMISAARVDERADVFSIGVIAAELAQRAHPFPLHDVPEDERRAAWVARLQVPPMIGEIHALNPVIAQIFEEAMAPDLASRPTMRDLRLRLQTSLRPAGPLAWVDPARLGDELVAWEPPGPRGRPIHRPVRLRRQDCPDLAVQPEPKGVWVTCAGSRRLRMVAEGFLPRVETVAGRTRLPWLTRAPGAWHDIVPDPGDGPAVRVTRPTERRSLTVRLEVRPGVIPVATGIHVLPTAEGIRLFAVDLAGGTGVLEIATHPTKDTFLGLDPARRGTPLPDMRVIVVWDEEAEAPFAGAFQRAIDGAARFSESLRPDLQRRVEQAIHAWCRSASRRSTWPWPEQTGRRVEALRGELQREPELRECARRLTADARTWFAASYVLALYDAAARPLQSAEWLDIFATAVLHAHRATDVYLHPRNPTPLARAMGGPTRVYPGPLPNRSDGIVDAGALRTLEDVYVAERLRMSGSQRPVVELVFLYPAFAAHIALHPPTPLVVGRWDRTDPRRPHLALFASDRVARRCVGVDLLGTSASIEAYVDHVEVRGLDVHVYDPSYQRVCGRCGARWDRTEGTCHDPLTGASHGPTSHSPLATATPRVVTTEHGELGRGGYIELVGPALRSVVATRCFAIADGVVARVEESGEVHVHVRQDGVRVGHTLLKPGSAVPLRPGDRIEVPMLGVLVGAFRPEAA